MRYYECYRNFLEQLRAVYEAGEAEKITSLVFENITSLNRSDIIKHPDKELDEPIRSRLQTSLDQLLQHMPVQYVIGHCWFHHLKFTVNPNVLIPRPETEELVEWILEYIGDKRNLSVLDIGTGSGCIAISLKKIKEQLAVTAIDKSSPALKTASQNAIDLGTSVDFIELDFLEEFCWDKMEKYDFIVSNPPYIPESEKTTLDPNVTAHEPHSALFVHSNSPLLFYEKIAEFGWTHLQPGGRIIVEIHEQYGKEVLELFSSKGYLPIIKKDLIGKDRMVSATRYQ